MTLTRELAIALIHVRQILLYSTLLLSLFIIFDIIVKFKKLNRKRIVLTIMIIFTIVRGILEFNMGISINETLCTLICLCVAVFTLISMMRYSTK